MTGPVPGTAPGASSGDPDGMDDTVSLPEAAAMLGVHYMTAYRYVRTGRLPARSVGGTWRVRRRDLAGLAPPARGRGRGPAQGDPTVRAPAPVRGGSATRSARMLEDRLVAGDEAGALAVCEEALGSWADPDALHLDVVAPALRRIGDRWAVGELSVADEHRATAVAARVVARLGPRFLRAGRARGTVVLGVVAGDTHSLPAAMAADLVRRAGFRVVELGGDTPAVSFAQTARATDRVVAVAVGATRSGMDDELARTVVAIHGAVPGVPVVVGGAGVPSAAAAAATGAEHWSGPEASGILDVLDAVVAGRDRR